MTPLRALTLPLLVELAMNALPRLGAALFVCRRPRRLLGASVVLAPTTFICNKMLTAFRLVYVLISTANPRMILYYAGRVAVGTAAFIFLTTYNIPWSTQHMAIISSTYFPSSKNYGPNTMIVLFSAQNDFWPPWPLLCVSSNRTDPRGGGGGDDEHRAVAHVRHAFTPISICRWSVYLATCEVSAQPTAFALRDVHMNSRTVSLPYRTTSMARDRPVVACFSPLFFNERWQLIIPTLEIYRQMGVSLQVYYIQSMLLDILQFMQIYERMNVSRVKTWSRIDVDGLSDLYSAASADIGELTDADELHYDPNAELEWRNQAAAHTDCLLKYQESAEFIIVSDIDDVLIPRLGATFLDEFRWLANRFPSAAGFSYNRYNTELITSKSPDDFSLSALLNSARVANEWEDPKYVVQPSRVRSVWLHWPGIINRGRMVTVDDDLNFMLHFRNWSMHFELFRHQIRRVLSVERAAGLESEFRAFLRAVPDAQRVDALFDALPREIRYYPLIAECYNRIFYTRGRRPANCPGPIRCRMPPIEGLKCALARRPTNHRRLNANVVIHSPAGSGEFVVSNVGCRM